MKTPQIQTELNNMIDKIQQNKNQQLWLRRSLSEVGQFENMYANRTQEDDKINFSSWQSCAFRYINLCFTFSVTDYKDYANTTAARAIAAATKSLPDEDYDQLFSRFIRSDSNQSLFILDPAIPPDIPCQITDKDISLEKLYGQGSALRWLAIGHWFQSTVFPDEVFSVSTRRYLEYCQLNKEKLGVEALKNLLIDYIVLGDYESALTLGRRDGMCQVFCD